MISLEKHRIHCISCGEKRVRMRKGTNEMVSEVQLRNIRLAGSGFCLAVISLTGFGVLFSDSLIDIATAAGSIALAMFFAAWLLSAFTLTRKKKRHYKCSNCGYTWDA
jgi:hypothetical protein